MISPPSLVGKGAGGLGFALAFPHDVKSQIKNRFLIELSSYLIKISAKFTLLIPLPPEAINYNLWHLLFKLYQKKLYI